MRVLMTADPGSPSWPFVVDLIAGLGEHGVDIALATMGTRLAAGQRSELRAIPGLVHAESDFRLEWMPDPWDDVAEAGRWLLELRERHGAQLVHCNHLAHGQLDWGVPVLMAGHACAPISWPVVRGQPDATVRYVEEVGRSLRASQLVVAPTHAMLACLDQQYGPIANGTVIHSARRAFPHTSGRKEAVIFASGRLWDDAKNLAALGRVARTVPWPIHVAGTAIAPTGLDASIPHVDLLGTISTRAAASWYRRAGIFVLPARLEPTGLMVLDAARAGCALVLGDIAGLRELWDGAALFVPPDDDAALAQALTRVALDAGERARLSRLASERALAYSHERCIREYLVAYRVLCGGYDRLFDGIRQAPAPDIRSVLPTGT